MTVSGAIINWLKQFQPQEYWNMQKINTDLMHSDVDYVLVKEPVRNVKTFISGTQIITENYQLRARLDACDDNDSVDNNVWLEQLTEWVEEQNKQKKYPVLPTGVVQAVGISSPFYMGHTDERKALYQLTIFIRYMKEGSVT